MKTWGIFLHSVTVLATLGAIGCSNNSERGDSAEHGELALPLTTYGPSGTQYRLRDAEFEIIPYSYYDDYYGGAGASPTSIVVSSEDDPDASSIVVDLEEGYYSLYLRPDWRLEKVTDDGAETVEATLLSSTTNWIWISRRSTSWAEYEFGLGERSIWMNGQLNLEIQVYEDPDDLGGYGGYYSGSGGGSAQVDTGVGGSF